MKWRRNGSVTTKWTLRPGYDFERIHMRVRPLSQDTEAAADTEGKRSASAGPIAIHLELSTRLSWDTQSMFHGSVLALGPCHRTQGWNRTVVAMEGEAYRSAPVGQNLLRAQHLEFVDAVGATMPR